MMKKVISLTRIQKNVILLIADLSTVPAAMALAIMLQYSTLSPFSRFSELWAFVPLLMIALAAFTAALGLRWVRLKDYDLVCVTRSGGLAALLGVTMALLMTFGGIVSPAGFYVILTLAFFALYAGLRLAMLQMLRIIYRRSRVVTRVAIYGAGQTGIMLVNALRNHPHIIPYLFLDDNTSLRGVNVCGLPVHSGAHLKRLATDFKIDRVILAIPSLPAHKQALLTRRVEKLGLEMQSLPAFATCVGGETLLKKLDPDAAVTLLSRPALDEGMDISDGKYADMNVLVSGAGGSIGMELCRQVLRCHPARLVLFEMSELALYNVASEMLTLASDLNVEIVSILGSVADPILVAQVLKNQQINIVLHAAAYKHVPLVEANLRIGMANNVLGTAILAQKSREAGVSRFVLVSSDKAVRPSNVMGATKRFAELVVQDLASRPSSTIFSIVRFGNVLGSSGSVIPLFQQQISCGGPVTLTDQGVTRYFMTVQEAARLVLLAGSFAEGAEVFILDMGKPILIRDLARSMIEASGYKVRDADTPSGDIEIIITGLRPGEKLHEELTLQTATRVTAHPKIICVRETALSELEIATALRNLRYAINTGSDNEALMALASAVPEYDPHGHPAMALPMQIVRASQIHQQIH
ncbi:polysaccharide biosynthesis protein [Phaeovulum sp.]|uniref:polysaccharide biosynthesis protein n=1 Tax=Phaeovulum sp. TaxID=2934796 RepID=UPI0039E5119E